MDFTDLDFVYSTQFSLFFSGMHCRDERGFHPDNRVCGREPAGEDSEEGRTRIRLFIRAFVDRVRVLFVRRTCVPIHFSKAKNQNGGL